MEKALENFIQKHRVTLVSALADANRDRQMLSQTTQWRDARFYTYCVSRAVFMSRFEVVPVISALSA